jgi:hypothetical protein
VSHLFLTGFMGAGKSTVGRIVARRLGLPFVDLDTVVEQRDGRGILAIFAAGASLAGYLTMPALAALLLVTAWLMSEPSRWSERMRLRSGDRALFFVTMVLTLVSGLTVAIAVGTAAGLALRIYRKDVSPAEWTPADRSKL